MVRQHWNRPICWAARVIFFATILMLPLLINSFAGPTGCISTSALTKFHASSNKFRLFGEPDKARRGPADNDFISRFFSKILPTPEDVGLTRFDRSTRPENYPCIKDEFADMLDSDQGCPDKMLIRQLLKNTNLETRDLQLIYDASEDGWRAVKFHEKLDKKGPSVVLARTSSGGIFGGYNPCGWVNYGEYRGSIAAFLFLFPNGDDSQRPIKLAKISGAGLAQIDDGQGPRFGVEGLTILLEKSHPRRVRSKLGLYYENLPDGGRSLLPLGAEDELVELKVFVGMYDSSERIPYSDAMPFSLN